MLKKSRYPLVYLKGIAMGAADVVPGVSGGTIAFITGIYEELLNSIRSVNPSAIKILFSQGIKAFWQHVNGTFLVSLLAGIATSFLVLAHGITWLMQHQPLLLWAFIFGLIVASCVHIGKMLTEHNWRIFLLFFIGAVLVYAVTEMRPVELEPSYWMIFAAGAIAICAMILPGISGSFMLLMMGLYGFMMEALKGFDVVMIALFISGCLTGILLFSHVLSWLFRQYRNGTIAFLTGMLLASLNAIWPWRVPTETLQIGEKVKIIAEQNVLPTQYELMTGGDAMVVYCVLLAFVGFTLVLVLEQFGTE